MAALTTAQIKACWHRFIEHDSSIVADWDKSDLATAVSTINSWIDDNQADFLATLKADAPAFADNSTAVQKTLLFLYVLTTRQGL